MMPPSFPQASTRLLAVCGWPVEHSLSPPMQNAALRAAGLDMLYVALPIRPENFTTAVRGLQAAGFRGLNCTLPHKFLALELCDALSETARLVGAVNTLDFREEKGILGHNTDVEGYLDTLRMDGGFDLTGRRIVQIGAGGAGQAMAFAAVQTRAAEITIVNRDAEKARKLARRLSAHAEGTEVRSLGLDETEALRGALARADIVANASALGLREGDPFPCAIEDISPRAFVFDAAYTERRSTAWLDAARQAGHACLDGIGMLVRQGAASFRIWTGIVPDTEAMFAALSRQD